MNYTVWFVVPCYNEEEVLPTTAGVLKDKLDELLKKQYISADSRVLFVDDGSKDKTWEIIAQLHGEDARMTGIKLAHNRGHQNALMAGMMYAKGRCDCMISLDADLQDDIGVFDQFIEKYDEGCEVVYGVRKARKKDSFFKRTTARMFYKFMNFAGAEVVYDHADYRLLGSKALEALEDYNEVNLFLRGIVPMIGYRSDVVEYERGERFAGESKYPLKKMLAFALEGITSLSVKPLRLITGLGFLIFVVSIIMIIYNIVQWAIGHTVAGWASLSCSVWFIGGLILLALGVVGEYTGKIYMESKERPRFIIREVLEESDEEAV